MPVDGGRDGRHGGGSDAYRVAGGENFTLHLESRWFSRIPPNDNRALFELGLPKPLSRLNDGFMAIPLPKGGKDLETLRRQNRLVTQNFLQFFFQTPPSQCFFDWIFS